MDRCFGVAPYSNEESVKWEGSNLQHHMRNTYSDSVYQWDNDKKEIIIYSKFTDDNLMV